MDIKKQRYTIPDMIRGLSLISMLLYHAMWDIVYIHGADIPWYRSQGAFIWQQSICWTFILLSGFCCSMGRHKLKRSLTMLICSCIVSGVTLIFMPSSRILFGILTLIGTGMLLMIPLEKLFKKPDPYISAAVCFLLFLLTRHIGRGEIGLGQNIFFTLPKEIYADYITAYLGFPPDDFISYDYFPVLPWVLLYFCGFFIYRIIEKQNITEKLSVIGCKPLEFLGRHSLFIYMIHQPVIYGILYIVFAFV
ncbi:MAG: DUF1624 domain-containing protein [Oscillospiraceae bacterium]|nr:DUF1624 domain-containing protein [Oscillospiraceae bacterium]